MEKEEILKKVREEEESLDYVKRCTRANICPECGEGLFSMAGDHPFLTQYQCNNDKCGKKLLVND